MNRSQDFAQQCLPKVAISILNWNRWQDTIKCLESVRGLRYTNYLTIVLDNGSWNDSAARIAAWARERLGSGHVFAEYSRETALQGGEASTEQALDGVPSPSRLVLIRNEENQGFTGGNNVAIHYALHRNVPADYVFLLNNDARVESDCLTRLLEAGARQRGRHRRREHHRRKHGRDAVCGKRRILYPYSPTLWPRSSDLARFCLTPRRSFRQ